MTSRDIFAVADGCIERGFFPKLAGQRFVLGLKVPGLTRAILHREDEPIPLRCSCRIWLMSGKVQYFLGDSHALPGDLDCGVRPPYTG